MTMADSAQAATMKQKVQDAINAVSEDLRALSLDIHAHPELNYEEVHAHQVLTDYLEQQGFDVERGAYGMETAFVATAGSGEPRLAVLSEYDALPGIGHACGHNLIAISGVAAGLALKEALGDGNGTIVVLGSPAEEGGGGKVEMIDAGAFESIDAALMLHPAPGDGAWVNMNAIQALKVEFLGRNAHAAALPWQGLNALDALVQAYNGISMLRQQMTPDSRVHGVIRQGGEKPNIIPDYTLADFYVRAKNDEILNDLKERVLACFEGAAVATGCRLEYEWVGHPYSNLTTNDLMAESYVENIGALGKSMPTKVQSLAFGGASTDMGNVSHVVPSIHPMFGIHTKEGNHTAGFTGAAATSEAHAETLTASKAMAMTAVDLFTDPAMLESVKEEFVQAHTA
jgi:amidohydrolase